MTMTMSITSQLAEQLDFHWDACAAPTAGRPDRRRVLLAAGAGLLDRPPRTAAIDFAYPEPDPAPFTTIAWRLAHVIVGVFAMRNHCTFRRRPRPSYETWPYATDAATALRQLDEQYRNWIDGVRGLSEDDLWRPCGPAEGPYADYPMAALVLHINREVIHHGAEIACIRDLYVHTTTKGK